MRKLLLFIVSAAMFVGGFYLLGASLLSADSMSSDSIHIKFGIVGVILGTFGLYLLWAHFLAPMFGIKVE